MIAGLPALIAAAAATKTGAEFFHRATDFGEIVMWIVHQLHAIWTDRAHESLRDERLYHRSEQKRRHVHVEQPGDAADRVICVQRAEDEVTGHGRANRDICRFDVANFADHHDVRVLPQYVTQTSAEF